MKATFSNSVDVLVKAYLNDTLVNGNCYACAVGNLICDAMGYLMSKGANESGRMIYWKDQPYPAFDGPKKIGWGAVVSSDFDHETEQTVQEFDIKNYRGIPKVQIDSTGYTVEEIAKIEYAFESARYVHGDQMFNGLIAVVDVLAEIHGVDLSTKEAAVMRFEEVHISK